MLPVRPKPPPPARASTAGQERKSNTTWGYPLSPWERRERGGTYYTRSRREGDRVVREYVGGGVLGEIAALQDEYERRTREEEAALEKEERQRLEELVAPVDELCVAAEVLARAALVAVGYRRHNRGEWRKRHEP